MLIPFSCRANFRKQNVDLQSTKGVLRVFGGQGQQQGQGGEPEEGSVPQAERDVGQGSCSKPGKWKGDRGHSMKYEPQTVGKSGLRPCFNPRLAVRARAMAIASAGRKGTS